MPTSCRPHQGVCWEGKIPLTWEPVLHTKHAAPEAVLAQLHALETATPHAQESGDMSQQIWWRIEQKLNVLLGVLPQIPEVQARLPPIYPVCFDAAGIDWLASEPITPAQGQLILYLSQGLPLALALPARLVACEAQTSGYLLKAQWHAWSEELHSAFDKFLFRHHRQQIRQHRQIG